MVKKLETELKEWTHGSIAAETDRLWDATLKASGKQPVVANMSPAPVRPRPPSASPLEKTNKAEEVDSMNRQLNQVVQRLKGEIKEKDGELAELRSELGMVQESVGLIEEAKNQQDAAMDELEDRYTAASEETAEAVSALAAMQAQQQAQQPMPPRTESQQLFAEMESQAEAPVEPVSLLDGDGVLYIGNTVAAMEGPQPVPAPPLAVELNKVFNEAVSSKAIPHHLDLRGDL